MDESRSAEAEAKSPGMAPHTKIVAGLVIGAVLGLMANWIGTRLVEEGASSSRIWRDVDANRIPDGIDFLAGDVADPIGRVFLRLILMVVVPLVVSALALGVFGLGDVRKLGRIGLRTLGLTVLASSIAVLLAITLVDLVQPGRTLPEEQRDQLRRQYAGAAAETIEKAGRAKSIKTILLDIIPENPLQEMAGAVDGSSKGNGMLAVMFFSLVLGIALASLPPERSRTLVELLEGMFAVSMVVIRFAMYLAPVAVGCLVFAVTARLGFDIFKTLFVFVATTLFGLGLQLVVVYSVLVRLLGRMSPRRFFRGVREAMWTAFGTSSSSATLPTALRVAEEDLGLPKEIAHFVLTIGATGNQNGTALYEGIVVLFLAQVFGIDLTFGQQIMVMLMALLAGVGTAGVPGGSLPMIVIVLQSVGVPGEGIGIILGLDRLLDMCRTVLNVTGDLVIAVCVARGEPVAAAIQP